MSLMQRCNFDNEYCTRIHLGTEAQAKSIGWQCIGEKHYCPEHNVDIFNGEQIALPFTMQSLNQKNPADRAAATYFSHRLPESLEVELLEQANKVE